MKKTLALILAFVMVFSTITVAFADEVVSPEAAALATIGMLEGDGDGVTAEYTAKELNKLTAAIMILKLKGLYADALEYEGVDNFEDAEEVAWEAGRNVLAFVKDNPTVGFGGNEKGEFKPYDTLSEQMLYKVLLENLDYKQNKDEVVGDFFWDETLEFAEGLGLTPERADKFTVDGLSKAVFGALLTDMKGGKAWIEVLVEAGKIDEDLALAAGLLEEVPEVTAAIKSAVAIGNTVVEVEFDAEVGAGAEETGLYAIEGLTVEGAVLAGDKVVRLTTSAQTAGKNYTLVVGEVKVNFGGKAKVSGAPELKKVTGTDTEKVEIDFKKFVDFESATNVDNYEIKGVTIVSAGIDKDDKNIVILVTEGLAANKTHTLKVTNIKSVDGVALKSASKNFYAKADKTAPKVSSVKADTFKRIIVKFNEELDKESAENVENYVINKDIVVEAAKLVKDDTKDEVLCWVELITSAMKSGSYTLTVQGVKDASVLANEMTKAQKVNFAGKTEDKTGPSVSGSVEVLNRNRVLVTFNDASRLDFATATDASNYELDKDAAVESAEMLPGFDDDTMQVVLNVSDIAEKTLYTLKVTGVSDEYGNEMKKAEKKFTYKNDDLAAAKIMKVEAKSEKEVEITFNKHVDPLTAKDVKNFSINNDIGTPLSSKAKSNLKVVTLKVNELKEGKEYKLTIDGLVDLAGNTIKVTTKFVARTTENDIEAPVVEDVTAINRRVLQVTLDESADIPVLGLGVTAKLKGINPVLSLGAVYDDNKILEFTYTGEFKDDAEYTLEALNGVKDKAGNVTAVETSDGNEVKFWGNSLIPDNIDFSWEQVNVEKYKLVFSEKVKVKTDMGTTKHVTSGDDKRDELQMSKVWYFQKKVSLDKVAFKNDINKYFISSHKVGSDYSIDNTEEDKKNETIITCYLEDTEKPYIEDVVAVYRNQVDVHYNEDIKGLGKYEISYYDINGKERKHISITPKLDADNDNVVNLNISGLSLESRFDYTLKVTTPATDLAGNKSEKDEEYTFQGTDLVAPGSYIKGVELINGTKAKVTTANIANGTNVTLFEEDSNGNFTTVIGSGLINDSKVEITTSIPMREDVDYQAYISDKITYGFEGIVKDSLSFDDDSTDVAEVRYDDMKSDDIVTINGSSASAVMQKDDKGKDTDDVDYFKAGVIKGKEVNTIVVKRGTVVLYNYVREGATAQPELNKLNAALKDASVSAYTLTDDVSVGTLNIQKPFTLTLGGKTLTGNVEVAYDKDADDAPITGKTTIDGVLGSKIVGNLIVNVPNADFEIGANVTVTGDVIINGVKKGTFTNNGTINGDIVVDTDKPASIENKGIIAGKLVIQKVDAAEFVVDNSSGKSSLVIENKTDTSLTVAGETVAAGGTGTNKLELDKVADEVYKAAEAVLVAKINDVAKADVEAAVAAANEVAKAHKDGEKEVVIEWSSDKDSVIKFEENAVTVFEATDSDVIVSLTIKVKRGEETGEIKTINVTVKKAVTP